jgi:hypothetical protein
MCSHKSGLRKRSTSRTGCKEEYRQRGRGPRQQPWATMTPCSFLPALSWISPFRVSVKVTAFNDKNQRSDVPVLRLWECSETIRNTKKNSVDSAPGLQDSQSGHTPHFMRRKKGFQADSKVHYVWKHCRCLVVACVWLMFCWIVKNACKFFTTRHSTCQKNSTCPFYLSKKFYLSILLV